MLRQGGCAPGDIRATTCVRTKFVPMTYSLVAAPKLAEVTLVEKRSSLRCATHRLGWRKLPPGGLAGKALSVPPSPRGKLKDRNVDQPDLYIHPRPSNAHDISDVYKCSDAHKDRFSRPFHPSSIHSFDRSLRHPH
jgi:hypothetical protein